MKYAIVIPDGAADEPHDALGGRTALEVARIPGMDAVSRGGVLGRSRNVPDRFTPASDVATLSLLGYDPELYYTGRAPLEAAAMGVKIGPDDWAVRCNLMTIAGGRMTDFTAGHITSAEGGVLMAAIQSALGSERYEFHPGVSYRNLLVIRGAWPGESTQTTPPHDVPDQPAAEHLPRGPGAEELLALMEAARGLLAGHAINVYRAEQGKRPANAIWLWGQGRACLLPSFETKYGLRGALISAVDLVRGVGVLAGMQRVDVVGATGYLDTDYAAKGRKAIELLRDYDLVVVHIEAPDEASHEGRGDAKVQALEEIDAKIVQPLHEALRGCGEYRLLISPDHSTLLRTRAHDRAPVPWAMCGTGLESSGMPYTERAAREGTGPFLEQGCRLMERFIVT
jgi:2,3-bisphosphoglycerate-independent phosphoglycerate mutase